jgi:hypothetical protein
MASGLGRFFSAQPRDLDSAPACVSSPRKRQVQQPNAPISVEPVTASIFDDQTPPKRVKYVSIEQQFTKETKEIAKSPVQTAAALNLSKTKRTPKTKKTVATTTTSKLLNAPSASPHLITHYFE